MKGIKILTTTKKPIQIHGMRQTTFFMVALGLVTSWACSDILEEDKAERPLEGVELTVHATLADVVETKTVLNPDRSIYWTNGDAINLFYGDRSSGEFISNVGDTPVQTTDFVGTLTVATGSSEAGMSAKSFWACYPYDENNTCDGTGVTITLPSHQHAFAGSFADKLNPSVATSPGLNLSFYNVGAPFYFSVTQEGVVSATFKGNNNEDVAGKVRVSMDADGYPVAEVLEGEKSITLTAPEGESFVPGTTYVLVLLPQAQMTAGYTVTFRKDKTEAECVVSKSVQFKRSKGRGKMDADAGLTYVSTTPDNIIYYTSLDGNTIIPNNETVFGANIISNEYADGFGILQFDGQVTRIGEQAFLNSSNLLTIAIPEGCEEISQSAFAGCTSLSAIEIPSSVKKMRDQAFYACSALERVNISDIDAWYSIEFAETSNPLSYAGHLFLNGSEVTDLVISAATGIADYAFTGCVGLASVSFRKEEVKAPAHKIKIRSTTLADNHNSIGQAAFRGCTNLAEVSVPDGITTIGQNAFQGCTSLSSVSLPESVTAIEAAAFRGCSSLQEVALPSNLTVIESFAFCESGLIEIAIPDNTVFDSDYPENIGVGGGHVHELQPS